MPALSYAYSLTRCFSSQTRSAAKSKVLVRARVPALGRSGGVEAVLLLVLPRGRPRGLRAPAFDFVADLRAFSLIGRWPLFICHRPSKQLPSQWCGLLARQNGNRLFLPHFSATFLRMADRKLGCVTLLLFLALCASVAVNIFLVFAVVGRLGSMTREEGPPRFREIVVQRGGRGISDRVAVITMRGLISTSIPGSAGENMVDDLRLALEQARDDGRVKAVVLEIDSPGGEVTAADMIYDAVVKTRAKKPVVVYMESLAASGGYYVSCGGKYLMANDTTITGSIGVIIQTLNYERLFNKVGLASVVFKSGKFKDLLNGARPMTPEEREFVQNFVMKTYDKFLGVVAKERGLSADALRNSIADGRILSGKEALENKLIDSVGQIEDAYTKAKQLGGAPDAQVVRYAAPFSLARIFRAFAQTGKLQLELPRQLMPQLESGRAYFLPSFYAP